MPNPVVVEPDPAAKPVESAASVATEPEPAPAPTAPEDTEEPGGDDPQAVWARKEYRGRKRAEADAQKAREDAIAATARADALERVRQTPAPPPVGPPAPQRFRPTEVLGAIEQGTVTRADALAYFGKPIEVAVAEEVLDRKLADVKQEAAGTQAQQYANHQIQLYAQHVPDVLQQTSEKFRAVKAEFDYLVQLGDDPRDLRTQLKALRTALGPLDRVAGVREAAVEQRRNAPVTTSGDGTGRRPEQQPSAESALTPRQLAYYKVRGWDAKADAAYVGIKSVTDLPKAKGT